MRGARHRFVAGSPLGKGFLTGDIDLARHLRQTDFRGFLPRFTPEALWRTRPSSTGRAVRRAQEGHAGPDRARLAARAEALDRSHPGARPSSVTWKRSLRAADLEPTEEDVPEMEDLGFAKLTIQRQRLSEAVMSLMDVGAKAGYEHA